MQLEGSLFFKGSDDSYQQYHCLLRSKKIVLTRRTENGRDLQDEIPLADLTVVTTKSDEPSPEPGSFLFQLYGKSAEYRFYVTDPDEYDRWVSSLARRIAKRKATASLAITFDQLVAKMKDPVSGFNVQDRSWRFRKYPNCFVASEAVDWMEKHLGISRQEAVDIGNRLLQTDLIHHCVYGWRVFKDDYLFFRWSTPGQRRTQVVVLGGGIAGSYVARELDSDPGVEVTLVDRKDYFEMTPAVLRTIAIPTLEDNIKFVQKIVVKHERYVQHGNIVVGESVKEVMPDRVVLETRTIPFDYLVIATGSLYGSNIKSNIATKSSNVTTSSRDFRAASLSQEAVEVQRADSVLIVGGGPVGVELAAEIISTYPSKKVILVQRGESLIPKASSKVRNYVAKFLRDRGVEVIIGESVQESESSQEYILKPSRRSIVAQKAFFCTGIRANSEFMSRWFSDPEYLSDKGFIKVNEYFQIKGHSNIFACGDIINAQEEKMAERALAHGGLVVQHIRRLIKGKQPKVKYTSPRSPPMFFLALGPNQAVIMAKWDYVLAGSAPAKAKAAFLTSYASNLRDVVKEGANVPESARWRGDTRLPCPPTLQNQVVLVHDAHTEIGFSFCLHLLQSSVAVRAVMPPSLHPKKRRDIEDFGGVVWDSDKKFDVQFSSADVVVVFDPATTDALLAALPTAVGSKVKQVLILHESRSDTTSLVKQLRETLREGGLSISTLNHPPYFELLLSWSALQGRTATSVVSSQRILQFATIEKAGGRVIEPVTPWICGEDVVSCAAAILFNPGLYRNRDLRIAGPEILSGEIMASQLSAALKDDILFVDLDNMASTSESPDGSDSTLSSGRSSRSGSISESNSASTASTERRPRRMTISELDLSGAKISRSPRSNPSSPRSGSLGDSGARTPRHKKSFRETEDEAIDLKIIIGRDGITFEDWLKRNLHVFVNHK